MIKALPSKVILPVACLALMLTAGCSNRYIVTMSNGSRVSAAGKPKLVQGEFVFKDSAGKTVHVPQGSVREVAPASMSSPSMNSGFTSEPMK